MRILWLFAFVWASPILAQEATERLRADLIRGVGRDTGTVAWIVEPGAGASLGSDLALPCLNADLRFLDDGRISYPNTPPESEYCPEALRAGARHLIWSVSYVAEAGVVRLNIADPEMKTECLFAVPSRTPTLTLATSCGQEQGYFSQFVYTAQDAAAHDN